MTITRSRRTPVRPDLKCNTPVDTISGLNRRGEAGPSYGRHCPGAHLCNYKARHEGDHGNTKWGKDWPVEVTVIDFIKYPGIGYPV